MRENLTGELPAQTPVLDLAKTARTPSAFAIKEQAVPHYAI
jgi:hypothetical protein